MSDLKILPLIEQRHAPRTPLALTATMSLLRFGLPCGNSLTRQGIAILDASPLGLTCATTHSFKVDDVVEVEVVVAGRRLHLDGTVRRINAGAQSDSIRTIGVQLVPTPASESALRVLSDLLET